MQSLPTEVVQSIVHGVDLFSDMVSLSQTCRYLHAQTIPLIYRHTTVDLHAVYASQDALSRADGPLPPCLAQLQGMARNSQGQCHHVQKLSVVNEGDWSVVQESLLYSSMHTIADNLLDERNGIQFLINCLLEAAIPFMKRLVEFEWLVIAYPSNGILQALSEHRLSSFTHLWPEDRYSLKQFTIDYPSPYNPDIQILNTENLTSLSLYYIGTNKAVDDAVDLIFRVRHQLKTLRIHLLSRWTPEIEFDRDSEEAYNDAIAYDNACAKDTLYPLIHPFTTADEAEPMKLEELEIQGISDEFSTDNWIRAFDFHSIQRLTLIHRNFYFGDSATEFWTYLKENKISFKMLKTDCENEALEEFISSFQGLETLLLFDRDKRASRLSTTVLAGHFHSLKRFYYPNNIHGFSIRFRGNEVLREIVANCPLLEELGIYIDGARSMEASFKLFDESQCLKRLYITCATREVRDLSTYPYLNHDEFLQVFFSYFGPRNSAFFNRLERLSYYRTLWEIVPIDLDNSELADMEYELNYEPLSDGELEALDQDRELGENVEIVEEVHIEREVGPETAMEEDEDDPDGHDYDFRWLTQPSCFTWSALDQDREPGENVKIVEGEHIEREVGPETAMEQDEDDLDGHDYDFRWLTQPFCFTWSRATQGFSRMPLRVSWMDYRDDDLAWTVYQWVIRKEGVFEQGLLEELPRRDDWADESDVGLDGYTAPQRLEEEEEDDGDEEEEEGEEGEGTTRG